VALDGLSGIGVRRITIYDPKKPSTPLHEEDVILKKDTFLKIETEAVTMPVKGSPPPPKFKFSQILKPTKPATPCAHKPGTTQPKNPLSQSTLIGALDFSHQNSQAAHKPHSVSHLRVSCR